MQYRIIPTNDHDKKLRIAKTDVFCYSKKHLKKLYPEKDYEILGEAKPNNRQEKVGELIVDPEKDPLIISEQGSNSHLLYKRAGYARVGTNEYVALLKHRWPFLLILMGLLALIVLLLHLLIIGPDEDSILVITPDHPLPEVDEDATPIEGDDTEKADVDEGGGSVSMIYTLEASIVNSTGDITIYFKNPNASSHNVVVEMYLVDGPDEILVAQSGLIEPGYELNHMELLSDKVDLSEGIYTGLYKLQCYDPETGERALVAPEITGLNVTVTEE